MCTFWCKGEKLLSIMASSCVDILCSAHQRTNRSTTFLYSSSYFVHIPDNDLKISADDMTQCCTESQKCRCWRGRGTVPFPGGPQCCRSDVQTHSAIILQIAVCLSGGPWSMRSDENPPACPPGLPSVACRSSKMVLKVVFCQSSAECPLCSR